MGEHFENAEGVGGRLGVQLHLRKQWLGQRRSWRCVEWLGVGVRSGQDCQGSVRDGLRLDGDYTSVMVVEQNVDDNGDGGDDDADQAECLFE